MVGSHDTLLLGGEVEGQVQVGGFDPRRLRIAGCHSEAGVVALYEPEQEAIGILQGADTGHAHLFDQPVLQRAPQPFDTTLGLAASLL